MPSDRNTFRQDQHLADLRLADDPHALERARWRAVLGDAPPAWRPRRQQAAGVGLSVVLGVLLAVGLVAWGMMATG